MSDQISKPSAKLTKQRYRLVFILIGVEVATFALALVTHGSLQNLFLWVAVGTWIVFMVVQRRNRKSLEQQGGDSAHSRLKTLLIISHLAGLEDYGISRAGSVMIVPEGVVFNVSKNEKKLISWDKIEHVEAGSEEQLRSRVTLSRVLITGVFALALKKERKQKFYLTIETVDGVGLWNINASGKNNRVMQEKALTFASKCNSQVKAGKGNKPVKELKQSEDVLDQIEKLSELLKKKIITQADFDLKKDELLKRL
jgi:hypothetical protein